MKKRIISYLLVLVMLAGLIPAMGVPVEANTSSEVGRNLLLRGFNVLSGRELRNSSTLNTLIDPRKEGSLSIFCDFTPTSETEGKSYSGRSMSDFMLEAGISTSISASASVSVGKLFKASASTKFSMSASGKYNNSYDSFFHQSIVHSTLGKNEIRNPQ